MYRHEAIGIARKVMQQAGITTELPPWVIDAILGAVNGTVVIPAPVPVAWRRAATNYPEGYFTLHHPPSDPREWQPLYAVPVVKPDMFREHLIQTKVPMIDMHDNELQQRFENLDTEPLLPQSTVDLVAGDPESPIPPLYPVSDKLPDPADWQVTRIVVPERTPVAWRRRSLIDDGIAMWVYWQLETPPSDDDGHDWQPLYAD